MTYARGITATAVGILLALTAAAPAPAQVCSTSCSRYDQGQCVEETQTCTTPPPPPPAYGAIAYGRTSRAWGYSDHWGSQAKAESVAMQNCAQHGNDCEIMVWFERNCGAVAAGDGTTAFWGLGDGEGAAREAAQNKCAQGGGKTCVVQVSKCSR